MDINIFEMGKRAREASRALAIADEATKNKALLLMAKHLRNNAENIIKANKKDLENLNKDATSAFIDRLMVTEKTITSMIESLETIANLDNPVDKVLSEKKLSNGLVLRKVSVPIGVIAVIYESRPNVTVDSGALCMKSGNAVILRGGSESFNSCTEIMKSIHFGLKEAGLPTASVQMVMTPERRALEELILLDNFIDVIIPRGGKGLLSFIKDKSSIPLLLHLDGICHTYIHKDADLEMSLKVILNAKMRRTGVCNATETILIDDDITLSHLPRIVKMLIDEGCEVRGDEKVATIDARVKPATEEDWKTEYLDAIVSIKTVKNIDEAISHINNYSSKHTEAIITDNEKIAERFLKEIGSAVVMHNASTQFCDGGQFGMGAEIGISTGKLHARGPVGLEQLTTFKYIVLGNGQIRPK